MYGNASSIGDAIKARKGGRDGVYVLTKCGYAILIAPASYYFSHIDIHIPIPIHIAATRGLHRPPNKSQRERCRRNSLGKRC
jgi:hypothetical protein